MIPREAEAALLVEVDGDRQHEVRDRLHRLVDELVTTRGMACDARQAFDPAEVELFWQLASPITPILYRMKGNTRPVPVIEDIAVPPQELPDFLVRMQNALKRHQTVATMYAPRRRRGSFTCSRS